MAKRLVAVFALFALTFSLTAIGFAQESTVKGNLGGVVTDPSGAVVAGANVTVVGPIGEKTVASDAEGRFLFSLLTPGYYSVKISKEGFKSAEVKTAEVVTGRTSSVTVKLELGASATTIEVNASSVQVDTTSTAAGSNLTDTFYQSVPVATWRYRPLLCSAGRNFRRRHGNGESVDRGRNRSGEQLRSGWREHHRRRLRRHRRVLAHLRLALHRHQPVLRERSRR